MKSFHVPAGVCLIVPLALALGCGRSQKAPVSDESETFEVVDLAELDEPMPPLDADRIEVSPPKGWHTPSRSSEWIVRFTVSRKLSYPSIIITAEDFEKIFNVSKDNVDEFAQQIALGLEQDPKVAKLADPVTPVEIGTLVGVTHRRRAKIKKSIIERQFVETVVAGRKYTLELRARKGTLDEYRPHLLAVANGIKFLKAETAKPPEE